MTETTTDKSENSKQDGKTPSAGNWLYQFRYILLISVIFISLSVYYALTYFPELSTARAVGGGIGFGLFCSLCAATYSQLI